MSKKRHNYKRIAIIQTATHPALDLVVKTFQDRIRQLSGNATIEINISNGQGSMTTIYTIAQRVAIQSYDLVIGIGTLATQALISTSKKSPIMFAAVTDVSVLGTVDPQKVTGFSDMIDITQQLNLVQRLFPNIATIGIVANPSDPGSAKQYAQLSEGLELSGKRCQPVVIQTIQDVSIALANAARTIELLLVPIDNIIALTINQVIKQMDEMKIPVMVSDVLLVSHGAVAGCGVDYKQLGNALAEEVYDNLVGKKMVSDCPISSNAQSVCCINTAKYDVYVPGSVICSSDGNATECCIK